MIAYCGPRRPAMFHVNRLSTDGLSVNVNVSERVSVNAAKKIEILHTQRDPAHKALTGRAQLEAWREKTATVLRLTLGEDHQQTYSFDNISFVSRIPSSNSNLEMTMRKKGVDRAVAVLDAAIFEVEVADQGEGVDKAYLLRQPVRVLFRSSRTH